MEVVEAFFYVMLMFVVEIPHLLNLVDENFISLKIYLEETKTKENIYS